MKFNICAVSNSSFDWNKIPVKATPNAERTAKWEPEFYYEIEISNLEELINLQKTVGHDLILSSDNGLEIYNGYIE